MDHYTESILSQLLWAAVLVFILWGFGWMIYTGETQEHEREMACIEARGVIADGGDCIPVMQK